MTEDPSWAPADVDPERPNAARMYDYFLGGGANFAADREYARKIIELAPEVRTAARLNRAFLRRSVEYCLDNGVRQFLDIGSGIPTAGNVHEIAAQRTGEAHVVYVDHEAVAVTTAERLLAAEPNARVVRADLRDPETILRSDATRALLDLDRPVALLMVAVLHFIPDSPELDRAIRHYLDALAPGSVVVVSHATTEGDPDRLDKAAELYRNSSTPFIQRSAAEITAFLDGTEIVDPGLVWTPQWRPYAPADVPEHPEESRFYACVGRKP